jgi:hypothetical protein
MRCSNDERSTTVKRYDVVKGVIAGLALMAGSVVAQQAAPVTAAGPRLILSATNHWITVSGYNFSTRGSPVVLDAFGLKGGHKTFLAQALVTPLTKAPHLSPCLVGALCYAGGFSVPNMQQPGDPCLGGGFAHIEVDAWTSHLAASARATVSCPPPFKG